MLARAEDWVKLAGMVEKAENEKKKAWSAKGVGSGTFIISKPKRKYAKQRAARVRNKRRAR